MNEANEFSDENLPPEEPPKPLPRKIFFGAMLICLGIYIILNIMGVVLTPLELILLYLPTALIIAGIIRIWIKGLFNVFAQTLIIFGLLIHIAFAYLDHPKAIQFLLPVLIIWFGTLVFVKGILIWRKNKLGETEDEAGPYSIYDWKPPEGEGIDDFRPDAGSGTAEGSGAAEDEVEPEVALDVQADLDETEDAAAEPENTTETSPEE